jgi:4-amino-4-deoxy-L-arabinose transferase-like glycosyltransferase
MNKKNANAILLALIVAAGLFVRVARLDKVPPGFYIDEASFGYNAYSILKTGRDEFGTFLPLYTPSFGTGKNPVYLYATVASVAVFGLNEFAERLPAALFGAAAVWAAYLLGAAASKRRSVGLLAALFLALDPWHLFMSRFGVEMTSMMFLISTGAFCLLRGAERRELLPWGGLFLGISLYAYAPALLFAPLIFAAFILCFRARLGVAKKQLAGAAGVFILLGMPHTIGSLKPPEQSEHFRRETISNPDNFARGRDELLKSISPFPALAKLYENNKSASAPRRAAFIAAVYAKNYFSYFSPSFLFLRGDRSTWRAGVKGYGQFYLIAIPLLILGITAAFAAQATGAKFMLCWLLLYPAAAALTVQTYPQATRGVTALPCFEILAAWGVVFAADQIRRRTKSPAGIPVIAAALIAVYLLSAGLFMRRYFTEYPKYSSYGWNAGYKEAFDYLRDNDDRYHYVIVSWNIPYSYIYVLFYTKYEPEIIQKYPLQRIGPYPVGMIGKCVVGSPYLWARDRKLLYITGFWERPDLKPIDILPPGSIVKISEGTGSPLHDGKHF